MARSSHRDSCSSSCQWIYEVEIINSMKDHRKSSLTKKVNLNSLVQCSVSIRAIRHHASTIGRRCKLMFVLKTGYLHIRIDIHTSRASFSIPEHFHTKAQNIKLSPGSYRCAAISCKFCLYNTYKIIRVLEAIIENSRLICLHIYCGT